MRPTPKKHKRNIKWRKIERKKKTFLLCALVCHHYLKNHIYIYTIITVYSIRRNLKYPSIYKTRKAISYMKLTKLSWLIPRNDCFKVLTASTTTEAKTHTKHQNQRLVIKQVGLDLSTMNMNTSVDGSTYCLHVWVSLVSRYLSIATDHVALTPLPAATI